MSKRESGAERRARLEQMRREQEAAQRKRTLLTAGIGLGAGVLIIGGTVAGIAVQQSGKVENQPFSSFGVPASEAGCTDVTEHETSGGSEHVTERVEYDSAPPHSGKHRPYWDDSGRTFYSVDDALELEVWVHNLEHGYNFVWYLPTLDQAEVDTLRDLSKKISDNNKTYKFKVVPWDTSRGEFPKGKTYAMSHWGRQAGYVQYCEKVSGEAVDAFVDAHPITDAPEPNGG